MTKRLEDLIADFNSISFDDQIERVRKARNARTLERPVAAVKRVKKEAKKKAGIADKTRQLFLTLSPEQKAAIIAKLKGETT
jgi:hypothetical protein